MWCLGRAGGGGGGMTQTAIFPCGESTCILAFKLEREAQAHIDTGKYVRELESLSMYTYDTIRIKWAERVIGICNVDKQTTVLIEQDVSGSPKTT